MPALPFKLNQDRRHHIQEQKRKVMNWREYDKSLRRRGSLTVWFADEAVQVWKAQQRTSRGRQPDYSPLAILTALTLRGVPLAVPPDRGPDRLRHRPARARPRRPRPHGPVPPGRDAGGAGGDAGGGAGPMHLLVDSTGLQLYGAGEWLAEKHGTKRRWSWRELHLGVDARTGRIVAAALTDREVDDASQVAPLLDQVEDSVASLTGDGAYNQESVYADVAERHPDADVIVPPRSTAVPSDTAETAPTQRDRRLQLIAEKGRMGWQKASGYNARARAEAIMGRFKRVIGDALRSRTDRRRTTEVNVGVQALNRMLEPGRPNYVRTAWPRTG